MAYTTGDTILDDHYNGFVTSLNAIWGTGSGDAGYGQTSTIANVSPGQTVSAAQWTNLLSKISSAASHQGSSITAITNPSAGNTISAYTALSGNLSTITTNRLNIASRAALSNTSASTTTNLTGTITQTGKFTFSSAETARFFFNAGGRLSINWSISGYTANLKANNWNTLLNGEAGTYYIYAQSSGKSGGSGTVNVNNTNLGWHDLTGAYQVAFRQYFNSGGYAAYTANYVQLDLYKSGAEVFWRTYLVDAAADSTFNKSVYTVLDYVTGTKQTFFGHEAPTTTYLGTSWSNPTLNVTANG